jgi:proton-translocating NADH-quinone oxidoreductase chain N
MNFPSFLWMMIFSLVFSPLVYLVGRIESRRRGKIRLAKYLALLPLLASWVFFAVAFRDFSQSGTLTFLFGSIWLQIDGISFLLAAVVLGLGTLVVLYSGPYMAGEAGEEKYYAMLLAMLGVMIGLGCTRDLFNLWVWFEAMAVSSYLLVAFYRNQPESLESGIKYLVQSATGSVLVLLGIGLVLAQTGSLDLLKIQAAILSTPMLAAAGVLFVVGFGVKIALVPLHTWLPDAHSQAPSGISAMLSGVVIETGLVALLRVLSALFDVSSWGLLLAGFGALNMLYGNLLALKQIQVKRLLAYSSLSHMGYILLGLGFCLEFQTSLGAQGAFFHIINHAIMKGSAFLAAGTFIYINHQQTGKLLPLTIQDLAGVSHQYPLPALALSLAVLGLGGLPPLAGFMSKWLIFLAGFNAHSSWAMGLVIFAALNSVLSLAYYAPLVNIMYRKNIKNSPAQKVALPWAILAPQAILSLAVIVIGLWPSIFDWLTTPAAQALLVGLGQ